MALRAFEHILDVRLNWTEITAEMPLLELDYANVAVLYEFGNCLFEEILRGKPNRVEKENIPALVTENISEAQKK